MYGGQEVSGRVRPPTGPPLLGPAPRKRAEGAPAPPAHPGRGRGGPARCTPEGGGGWDRAGGTCPEICWSSPTAHRVRLFLCSHPANRRKRREDLRVAIKRRQPLGRALWRAVCRGRASPDATEPPKGRSRRLGTPDDVTHGSHWRFAVELVAGPVVVALTVLFLRGVAVLLAVLRVVVACCLDPARSHQYRRRMAEEMVPPSRAAFSTVDQGLLRNVVRRWFDRPPDRLRP